MRQLLPHAVDDVDPINAYQGPRPTPPDRPWVLANMVTSTDGATSTDGRSAGISSDTDRSLFHVLRGLADLVLIGAGTARAERYRPIVEPTPTPIAVVSRSLSLDWEAPFFTEAVARPLVITCQQADGDAMARARQAADLVVAGHDRVDLRDALALLRSRGHEVVLTEGGPTLLGELGALDAIDELCLTISPLLSGFTGSHRLTAEHVINRPHRLRLAAALEDDDTLFLRYLVDRGGVGS